MASTREMVSKIRSSFKLIALDNLVTDRFIANELKSVAFKLIKQQQDKRKLLSSPTIFTELKCLELEEIPLAQCCNYTSPCTIRRSIKRLPKLGESSNFGILVQGVFSIDGKNM